MFTGNKQRNQKEDENCLGRMVGRKVFGNRRVGQIIQQQKYAQNNRKTMWKVQRCRDVGKDVFMEFIDYTKAFDRLRYDKLIEIMTNLNLDL